jgi:hypothetical protein
MRLNDNAKVRVEQIADTFPILFIDDFYADPMTVREFALSLPFDGMLALYPGRHAFLNGLPGLDDERRAEVSEACYFVAELLTLGGATLRTDFSLITTPGRLLVQGQKHPHVDLTPILAVLYLNPESLGGTSFYRNREMGNIAVVGDEDMRRFTEFAARAPTGRVCDSYEMVHPDLWEKVYETDGRFNRLAAYPGNVFHWVECGRVPEPFDPALARLTQRFIIPDVERKP